MQFRQFSMTEKLSLYHSEYIMDLKSVKIYLCIIACMIGLFETIQTFAHPSESTTLTSNANVVLGTSYLLACLCLYLSLIKQYKFSTPKFFKMIKLIFCLGIIVFACGIFIAVLLADKSLDAYGFTDTRKYISNLLDKKAELWLIILIDMIVPYWYLKFLIPLSLWVPMIIQYYRLGMEYKAALWTNFFFAFVYMGFIFSLRAYIQYKTYLRAFNAETICEVQKNALDMMSDAIAFIDSNHQTVYSNSSFKALCNNNLKELSQKLTDIRKVGPLHTYVNTTDLDKVKLQIQDETKHNFMNEEVKKEEISRLNTITLNFIEVLAEIINNTSNESLTINDSFLFTGRCLSGSGSSFSCEIKFSYLTKAKATILVITNTSQKDTIATLEEINQYKDKLLATVSHDLRAPINGTLTFIENMLEHEEIPPILKQQYLVPAQRSSQFLTHLVNDILDFCQINVQKLRMSFESQSIADTIKNCHQLLEIQAKQKRIGFPLEIDERLPPIFTTDHNRLSQIVINLLTNALKFTTQGEVKLSATLIDHSVIEIKVKDTGVGIKDEDQKKLFQEFTRIDADQAQLNPKGVGLGLVIANQLAKMLSPSDSGIKVSSVYGEGAMFSFQIKDNRVAKERSIREELKLKSRSSFYSSLDQQVRMRPKLDFNARSSISNQKTGEVNSLLDCTISHPPPLMRLSIRNPNIEFKSRGLTIEEKAQAKVLIVDDDPFNVLALESVLKKMGLTTDAAFNGQEAIQKILAQSGGYDVVFMDCEMPIMNGLESSTLLTKMMKNGEIETIPIIGCTGHKDVDSMEKCFDAGMADVLTKPVPRDKLKECLKEYLEINI